MKNHQEPIAPHPNEAYLENKKLEHIIEFYSSQRDILVKEINEIISDLLNTMRPSAHRIEPQHIQRFIISDILQNIPNNYYMENYDHGVVMSRSTKNYIRKQFSEENIQLAQTRIDSLLENFDNIIRREISNVADNSFSLELNLAYLGLEYTDHTLHSVPPLHPAAPPSSPAITHPPQDLGNSWPLVSNGLPTTDNQLTNNLEPNINLAGETPDPFIKSTITYGKFV